MELPESILFIILILIFITPIFMITYFIISIVKYYKNTKRIIATCPPRKFRFLDFYRVVERWDDSTECRYYLLIMDIENGKLYVLPNEFCRNFRYSYILGKYTFYKKINNQKIKIGLNEIGTFWMEKELPEENKNVIKAYSLSGSPLPSNAVMISARAMFDE